MYDVHNMLGFFSGHPLLSNSSNRPYNVYFYIVAPTTGITCEYSLTTMSMILSIFEGEGSEASEPIPATHPVDSFILQCGGPFKVGNNLAAAPAAVSCAYSSREWGIYWADSMAGVSQRERGRKVSLCFDGVVKHRERWMDGRRLKNVRGRRRRRKGSVQNCNVRRQFLEG